MVAHIINLVKVWLLQKMGKGPSYAYPPEAQGNKASLRRFIKRNLFARLCIAAVIISVVLATVVFFLEIKRLGRIVNNRASEIALNFNDEIRPFLDDLSSAEQAELRNKLKMLLIAGKFKTGVGQVIYAGIYDIHGKEIASERDQDCDYLDLIEDFMKSVKARTPETFRESICFQMDKRIAPYTPYISSHQQPGRDGCSYSGYFQNIIERHGCGRRTDRENSR